MPELSPSDAATNARLIRHGRLHEDHWQVYRPDPGATGESPVPPDAPGWIVPVPVWQTAQDALRTRRHPVALVLDLDVNLDDLTNSEGRLDSTGLAFIAIDFPVYTDGRGYSLAYLLRSRYGWTGELRAMGDVMIDTVHYQARVGFDSFLVKPGHDPQKALAALGAFTVHYQKTYPQPMAA